MKKRNLDLDALVNNELVGNAMFNLFCRWQDEYMYEDIYEYGPVIAHAVGAAIPNSDIVLLKCSGKPFGFTLSIDGEKVKLFTKEKGGYLTICAAKVC